MTRYYFMVHFIPKEADLGLLIGRCVSIMHGFICKHNIKGLGISLPAWTDATIGNVVAFVHIDENVLKKLSKQAYFQEMQDYGFLKISEISSVPYNCGEVRFVRNQGIKKIYVGENRRRLKRLEKRALARGEVFNPQKGNVLREFEVFHRVPIRSKSSLEDFILHIQKEELTAKYNPEFSSYGFASPEEYKGSVPDLSSMLFDAKQPL